MSGDFDDKDIKLLFERIAEHFDDADENMKAMFSMLVRITLKYRDMLMHSSGAPLSVGETREALDAFMEVMKTHRIPDRLDKRIHDLVILWLEELKLIVHH